MVIPAATKMQLQADKGMAVAMHLATKVTLDSDITFVSLVQLRYMLVTNSRGPAALSIEQLGVMKTNHWTSLLVVGPTGL